MGKRSDFSRVPKDYYRTFDLRAVSPLAPLLAAYGVTRFAEPCVGLKDLVGQLKDLGLSCVAMFDINPRRPGIPFADACHLTRADLNGAGDIITNPPWSRVLLHKLIAHLSSLAPTWLLFDADWMHTGQSARFMSYCTDVVSVGRLRFLPGTSCDGKDNCAWYRFDRSAEGCATVFHPRTGSLPVAA